MQQKITGIGAYHTDGYENLLAYQLAFYEALRLSCVLPPLTEEESPLVARLSQSSEKIYRRLALAWDVRQDSAQHIEHLLAAETLAAQVQMWVGFAAEGDYISTEEGQIHRDLYEDILKEIRELIEVASISIREAA